MFVECHISFDLNLFNYFFFLRLLFCKYESVIVEENVEILSHKCEQICLKLPLVIRCCVCLKYKIFYSTISRPYHVHKLIIIFISIFTESNFSYSFVYCNGKVILLHFEINVFLLYCI